MIKLLGKVVDALSGPPQIAGLFLAFYLVGSTSAAKAVNVKVHDTFYGLEFVKRRQEAYYSSIYKDACAGFVKMHGIENESTDAMFKQSRKVRD